MNYLEIIESKHLTIHGCPICWNQKKPCDVIILSRALNWIKDWAQTDPDAPGPYSASEIAENALRKVASE